MIYPDQSSKLADALIFCGLQIEEVVEIIATARRFEKELCNKGIATAESES